MATHGQPNAIEAQAFMQARASGDVDELLDALRKPAFRYLAAYALADLGEQRAIPGLLKLLEASDSKLRIAGARSLGRLRATDAKEAIYELADHDPVPLVREWAVYAVGLLGDVSASAWLLAKTRDASEGIRVVAWAALMAVSSPEAQTLLKDSLADRRRWHRWRTERAVRRTAARIELERGQEHQRVEAR